jgi:nitrogen regulatory protein PII
MKAIFIVYNQAHTEKVEYMFDKLKIRGFTRWTNLTGRGSETGDPHMNTHTWPEQNTARLTIVEDEMVQPLLDAVKRMDEINIDVGIRAFVWNVEAGY